MLSVAAIRTREQSILLLVFPAWQYVINLIATYLTMASEAFQAVTRAVLYTSLVQKKCINFISSILCRTSLFILIHRRKVASVRYTRAHRMFTVKKKVVIFDGLIFAFRLRLGFLLSRYLELHSLPSRVPWIIDVGTSSSSIKSDG